MADALMASAAAAAFIFGACFAFYLPLGMLVRLAKSPRPTVRRTIQDTLGLAAALALIAFVGVLILGPTWERHYDGYNEYPERSYGRRY